MSQKRDTDYLAVSTRIHAMENRMLTRERMERMIDAKDSGEAAKVLSECGYGELTQLTSAALEELLADARRNTSPQSRRSSRRKSSRSRWGSYRPPWESRRASSSPMAWALISTLALW